MALAPRVFQNIPERFMRLPTTVLQRARTCLLGPRLSPGDLSDDVSNPVRGFLFVDA